MELCEPQNFERPSSSEIPRPLCHCLNVTESEVRAAIADHELHTVRGVAKTCGAGGGCTACHRHIKRLLNEQAVQHRMQSLANCATVGQELMTFAECETSTC